jgi:hypothetical protein
MCDLFLMLGDELRGSAQQQQKAPPTETLVQTLVRPSRLTPRTGIALGVRYKGLR